ncbi:hypothetical protein GCM10009096_30110 [Parasphingorhabdus litoris]|uniref:Uncharacterized protein n=1 Tax=Parasphingorhabdus litoris TaxID=394733 RepID=A0ABP3KQY7_9SPHN|nr:hypothetical protein [Parasphingorhabdus litoris]
MTNQTSLESGIEEGDVSGKTISIMGAFFALIIGAAASLGYGAAAAFFPVVVVDLLFLLIAVIFVFGVFTMTGTSRIARLIVAIPGGLLCLVMMWFGWFWTQADYDTAMALFAGGPVHAFEVIWEIADGSGYTASRGFRVDVEVSPGRIKLFWALESLLFLLLPAAGAWLGMGTDDGEETETAPVR